MMQHVISTLGADLAKKLRSLRLDRGMTQGELAQLLGVGQSTIAMIERTSEGRPSFNLATLEALAWALDAELIVDLRNRGSIAHTARNMQAVRPVSETTSTALPNEEQVDEPTT